MKKVFLVIFLSLIAIPNLQSQSWIESFEGLDSNSLPPGWAKYNMASFPVDPYDNWTVRDSGSVLPGLSTAKAKAYTGTKSVGISWLTAVDTSGTYLISDCWLVSKKIHAWDANNYMSYWIALGSPTYRDSVQIWVSTGDSLPGSFTHYIETWSNVGTYGVFQQGFIPFTDFAGQDIYVGFRYNMDVAFDGYFVNLDEIEVVNPVIGIQQIGNEVPNRFNLKQNYPNPFNPVTNIEFEIAKSGPVNLVIFNSLGQLVSTLVDQDLKPGSYKYDFNASGLPSGSYFYRLTAGDYTKTNKMILVK
ncbi:MAG: T9SS type A sorting domain-containing protein [Ignavibacteria bacterium]|nr:T9SS type A sorting domain-containing protein [Ignavibacteria bacterium]